MINPERIATFVEYVARPLLEDVVIILEKANELKLPVREKFIRRLIVDLTISHVIGEIIRAICYIIITWIVCRTVIQVLL